MLQKVCCVPGPQFTDRHTGRLLGKATIREILATCSEDFSDRAGRMPVAVAGFLAYLTPMGTRYQQ